MRLRVILFIAISMFCFESILSQSNLEQDRDRTIKKAEEFCSSAIDKAINNQLDNAIKDFTQAIALNGNESKYFGGRGMAYQQIGKTKEALDDLAKAIALDPTEAMWYYHRGKLYYKLKDLTKSLSDFNAAILYEPDNIEYLMKCGFVRRETYDFSGALLIFNKVVLIDKGNNEAYLERGITYRFLKRLEDAFKDLNYAISLNPSSPYNHYHLALCYVDMNKYSEACMSMKKSCDLGLSEACSDFSENCNLK